MFCNIGYISAPISAKNPISEVARNGGPIIYADIGSDITPISADIGVYP